MLFLKIHSIAHKKKKEKRSLKVTYKVETNSLGIHNFCSKIFKRMKLKFSNFFIHLVFGS